MSRLISRAMPAAVALAGTVLLCVPAFAQPGQGGRGPGGRGQGGPGGGIGGLLRSSDIQAEIELVDDQKKQLEAIGEEMRNKMRSMFEGMRDLSPEERREKMQGMRGQMQEARSSIESRVKEVLLPHQLERLEQIQLQQQVRRGGISGALRGDLAEKLGITDEQRKELVAKAQEIQKNMQEKIAQIRKDSQDELLSVLTSEQRSKLEAMMGSDFDRPQRGPRDMRDRGPRGPNSEARGGGGRSRGEDDKKARGKGKKERGPRGDRPKKDN